MAENENLDTRCLEMEVCLHALKFYADGNKDGGLLARHVLFGPDATKEAVRETPTESKDIEIIEAILVNLSEEALLDILDKIQERLSYITRGQ